MRIQVQKTVRESPLRYTMNDVERGFGIKEETHATGSWKRSAKVAFTMERPPTMLPQELHTSCTRPTMLPKNGTHHVTDRDNLSLSFTRNQSHTRIKPVSCPRHSLTLPSYLMPRDLGLQLLDVTGGHGLILNLSVSSFYQLLKVLHFLLILFILYHSLL